MRYVTSPHAYESVVSIVWVSHGTHMNESRHTYRWDMSRHVTHMNRACQSYEWVMALIWMSHVTHTNETCHVTSLIWIARVNRISDLWHSYEWVSSHIWMTHMNESRHTYEWLVWISHVTIIHMNESRHLYEWVMARISMSHVTCIIELCHSYQWLTSPSFIWMWHPVTHAPLWVDMTSYSYEGHIHWMSRLWWRHIHDWVDSMHDTQSRLIRVNDSMTSCRLTGVWVDSNEFIWILWVDSHPCEPTWRHRVDSFIRIKFKCMTHRVDSFIWMWRHVDSQGCESHHRVTGVSRQSQVWVDSHRCESTVTGASQQSQVWVDSHRCESTVTGASRLSQVWVDSHRCESTVTGASRQSQVRVDSHRWEWTHIPVSWQGSQVWVDSVWVDSQGWSRGVSRLTGEWADSHLRHDLFTWHYSIAMNKSCRVYESCHT